MKRVIYKKTGIVDKLTKSFPAIMFRSRERNRNILIGNAPVEVTDTEYEKLKQSRHGKDIALVTAKTKLAEPMEIDINAPKEKVKKKKTPKKIKKKKGGKK